MHRRTTNPIESTFATVRHRTKVTKGLGSRAAGLAMAFKLIESAQARWRAVNAAHVVALDRAGATFVSGKSWNDLTTRHHPKQPEFLIHRFDYCSDAAVTPSPRTGAQASRTTALWAQ